MSHGSPASCFSLSSSSFDSTAFVTHNYVVLVDSDNDYSENEYYWAMVSEASLTRLTFQDHHNLLKMVFKDDYKVLYGEQRLISFTDESKLLVSALQETQIWGARTHYLRVESKNEVLLELNSLCDFSCEKTIRNMYAIRILLSPAISVPESYGCCAWVGNFKDDKFKLLNHDVKVPPSSFFHNESGFIA